MLPSFCLVGRLDAVEVIGSAVEQMSGGSGTRRVAKGIGELFAYTTVRAWWRRHCERLAWLGEVVSSWWALGGGRAMGEAEAVRALEALGVMVSVAAGVGLWPAVSLAVGGAWLSTTTDVPTTSGLAWSWMTVMAGTDVAWPP